MNRKLLAACLSVAFSAVPLAASAAPAYALQGAEIFAGPGNDFPVVAQLGPGVRVNVNGCLTDYSWCDVSFGPNRGWAYAGDLAYPYQNRRVPILQYGPTLALPTVTFSVGNYWDRYYRGRPFYRERGQWEQRWRDHDEHRADFRGNGDRGRDHRGNDFRGDRRGNDYRGNDYRGNDYRGNDNRGNDNRGNDRGRGDDNRGRGDDNRGHDDNNRGDRGR
jgi:uncharacterized protein YraI